MTDYVATVQFPAQIPSEKITEFSDFVTKSPAILGIDLNDLPEAMKPAKQFLETIWTELHSAAAVAFAEGSASALRISGFVALGGAIMVATLAPRATTKAIGER